ncbi:MAG: type II toxin-antitoxin system prevent-host-death family antitoxin, partial [Nocardioides sp.]|nr:type II toxin-antitoxin system prevent-host-death family antitoxin [Nocardioides sp.]
GAHEAKAQLPRLLDEVERGEVITITRHGREVARLVPAGAATGLAADTATDDLVAAIKAARNGVAVRA